MGVMQLLEGEFFTPRDPEQPARPGDVYWVPIPEIDRVPRILQVNRSQADNHFEAEFEVVSVTPQHFRRSHGNDHLPVKLLELGQNHEAMISRAQKRPCVILAASSVEDLDALSEREARNAEALGEPTYIVAPFTHVARPGGPYTFVPQLVARVRCLAYPQFFPLPELDKSGGGREPNSIVRLDRLRSTHLHVGCDHAGLALSEEVLGLLRAQVRMLAGAEEPDERREVREIVEECLASLESQAS